jgi:UDP-N-acetylglucosamine--N-acetylmuramyl-(pentapeptide) pyrophosphoryl-undecaprenol N-acetylglucosamine transferase
MIRKLLLTAGGTGGHIWPAISFGTWLAKSKPNISVEYICGKRPLEKEIYESADIDPLMVSMKGSPFSGSSIERVHRVHDIFTAFGEAKAIVKKFSPDACLLFGGYISFPVLAACRLLRVPTAVQEQNAYAGKVTRLAAMTGSVIFSGWKDCAPLKFGSYTKTGVPVRHFKKMDSEQAWKELGLPGRMPDGPKIVVFTGSLGSTPVKDMVKEIASREAFGDWTFLLPAIATATDKISENVYLLPKIWNAAPLFNIADMAVTRAGGSSLTEAGTAGVPVLIVPWRGAADDHQFHNAVAFASENAALIWDGSGQDIFAEKLLQLKMLADKQMQKTSSKLYNNAERICADLWAALSSRC